jgi:hypothetical protein
MMLGKRTLRNVIVPIANIFHGVEISVLDRLEYFFALPPTPPTEKFWIKIHNALDFNV